MDQSHLTLLVHFSSGCGTFFKITERIHKYTSLEKVDKKRLLALINRLQRRSLSFQCRNIVGSVVQHFHRRFSMVLSDPSGGICAKTTSTS